MISDRTNFVPWGTSAIDKTMNKEMKENIGNEYIRRVKLICKSNLNAGNFISGLNARAIGVMRYSTGEIGQKLDQKTKKIMTLNIICLHPRSCVARLYMKWKEGGGGLIRVEDCITTERRGLHDYLKESKEDMLSGALKQHVIEEGEKKEEFAKRKRNERRFKHEGTLQGQCAE